MKIKYYFYLFLQRLLSIFHRQGTISSQAFEAVHTAVAQNRADDLNALIRLHGPNVIKHCPVSNGMTPLMVAAQRGHVECLRRLLPWSNTRAQNWAQNDDTALMMAIQQKKLECVRALLPFSDPFQRDRTGDQALHRACFSDFHEAMDLFLEVGHPHQRGSLRLTPLMAAAAGCSLACVLRLLPVSNVYAVDQRGWNALMMASHRNSLPVLSVLLHAIDPLRPSAHGETALMVAVTNPGLSSQVRDALLAVSDPHAVNDRGETAFSVAARETANNGNVWFSVDALAFFEPDHRLVQKTFERVGLSLMPKWGVHVERQALHETLAQSLGNGSTNDPLQRPRARL